MSDPAADPPLPPPAPVQRRRRAAWILAAGLVLVAAVAVAAAWLWTPLLVPLFSGSGRPDRAAGIDRLQMTETALGREVAAAQAAQAALDRRVQALETRPAPAPADLSGVQQQIARLTTTVGALGSRVDTLDKTVHALPKTDPAEAALALVALQIDAAVRQGRPFAAEYDTLAALARGKPALAAAAAPLAGPATAGVASRTVLAERLHALAERAAIVPPPAAAGWRARILARLESLVTIRRLDKSRQTPEQAAIATAERAMAQGDLAGAVEAMRSLTGADAAAAQPWLHLAGARLQVETALDRLARLLAARLGVPAAASAPPG